MLVRFALSARGVIEAFFVSVLVVVSAIDIERRIIPNRIVLPATAIVLVLQVTFFPEHWVEWVGAAAAAAGFLLAAHLVYPPGMGMGDVKLALLMGAALGWLVGAAMLAGFAAAAVAGLVLMVRYGFRARKRAIPLGPFLALGAIAVLFLGTPKT
jgi:leader peptidase (prepilin peptidase) / N-methyltransferase